MWFQQEIVLKPRARGMHLVTGELVRGCHDLDGLRVGLANFFLQHTSASLSINENADPEVRTDMARWLDRAVPDGAPYFEHTAEGADDMPAHVKSALFGCSLAIPIANGALALGTWQGIWLCEHRDSGGSRTVVATLWGESR